MTTDKPILFPPYRLDPVNQCVWRDSARIGLKPKAFSLLVYLLQHAGRLVTKDELMNAIWPETYVGEAVLKVVVGDLRRALGDDIKHPKYIETLHRRGYRFVAAVNPAEPAPPLVNMLPVPPARRIVGRDEPLAMLHKLRVQAENGACQTVFVTGEAGIGKTSLIEAFLDEAEARSPVWIARGQCFEHYGSGEAYFPVLDALSRLKTPVGGERLAEVLARYAPTWLMEMPALVDLRDRARLQERVLGATRERMLREIAEAFEVLTAEQPMILVLEDLHWSDPSSIDLISCLARRPGPARLLLIATYRPVEAILESHPVKALKQDLRAQQKASELSLDFLDEAAIAEYLRIRLGTATVPHELVSLVQSRTDGNPLFIVNVVDYALSKKMIGQGDSSDEFDISTLAFEAAIPDSLRQMIEKQIERLTPEEQQTLEAASVVGVEFSSAAAAAALDAEPLDVEECCELLAKSGHFLSPSGFVEMPDGTIAGRFVFRHAFYQNVLYQRLPQARQIRFHLRLGNRAEVVYGDRVTEIASELALHFERGRSPQRAIKYLLIQAELDTRRYSNSEAHGCLQKALALASQLPEPERSTQMKLLLEQSGLVLRSMGDMNGAAAEFEALVEIAHKLGDIRTEASALMYAASALSWVDRDRCLAAADRAVSLAPTLEDPVHRAHVLSYGGYWHFLFEKWRDEDARLCVKAIEAARAAGDQPILSIHVCRHSFFLAVSSEYRRAVEAADEGMRLSSEAGESFDYLLCHFQSAWALLHLGEWNRLDTLLASGISMAERNGHTLWSTLFQLERAWLMQRAFAYQPSLILCDAMLEAATESGHSFSKLVALVLKGFAHLGLDQLDEAWQSFERIVKWRSESRILMDWMWTRQLHYGLGVYWYLRGNLAAAREHILEVCALSQQPFERTLLALGLRMLATLDRDEGNNTSAHARIEEAIQVVDSGEAPLAAWQVYETAAELFAGRAGSFRAQAGTILEGLLSELASQPEIAGSLRSHPRAVNLMSQASSAAVH